MPIRTKYREVLDLIKELNGVEFKEWEDDGKLILKIKIRNKHDKKLITNKIEEVNYMHASDLDVEFKFDEEK